MIFNNCQSQDKTIVQSECVLMPHCLGAKTLTCDHFVVFEGFDNLTENMYSRIKAV